MARKAEPGAPASILPSAAAIAQVDLDPELFICVLEDLADVMGAPRRRRPGIIEAALASYCDFYDLDRDGVLEPQPILEMAALASRLSALTDLAESIPPPEEGRDRHRALAEAACTARLIQRDGKPAFQILDFLAALGRAEGAG